MKTLAICIDSLNLNELNGFMKAIADNTQSKGIIKALGLGHTVTSAWAIMTGTIPRYNGRMVGDWYYTTKDGNRGTHDLRTIGETLIGKSGLNEIWFNFPLIHPIPRLPKTVIVGGAPWFKIGNYTQPPWLEEELFKIGYIPDVPDEIQHPDINMLMNMAEKRGEALKYVLHEFDWDFAIAWFPETDRIHHMEHGVSPHDTVENRLKIINLVDRIIFEIVREFRPDNLLLFSDHGYDYTIKAHSPNGFYVIRNGTEKTGIGAMYDILPTIYYFHKLKPLGMGIPLQQRHEEYINPGIDKFKITNSLHIIADAINKGNTAVAWSGGKDSTLVYYLASLIDKNVEVLFIDTNAHFFDTKYYINVMKQLFNMNLYIIKPKKRMVEMAVDKKQCCYLNKVEPLLEAIKDLNIKYLITGIRKSDMMGRENAKIIEEKNGYYQVNPILDWTENEILNFLEVNGIPVNPLYFKGFRSIDCVPCTQPVWDLSLPERDGRKEKDAIVSQLRAMGYF
ncbi:MAG: phosphoadenosine phosphosulfate reductase family protein [Thermoplasmatales archaeon]